MNIKDLKQHLEGLPDEAVVIFRMVSGCCGDYEDLEVVNIEKEGSGLSSPHYITVDFASLPGYKTCRQASGTILADKEYHK